MNRVFFSHYREGAGPAREQNLFAGLSKHLYCLKDGTLKFQQKPLDPRLPGKDLLMRLVLLDVDTGTVYGEFHRRDDIDLLGFLARAWAAKPQHPMQGTPQILNVPQLVHSTPEMLDDLQYVREITQVNIGILPPGFAAGIHAVKEFEKATDSLTWRWGKRPASNLLLAQICSALLSGLASNSASDTWRAEWKRVAPLAPETLAAIDECYEPSGAWRTGAFSAVLDGLPQKDAANQGHDDDDEGDLAADEYGS